MVGWKLTGFTFFSSSSQEGVLKPDLKGPKLLSGTDDDDDDDDDDDCQSAERSNIHEKAMLVALDIFFTSSSAFFYVSVLCLTGI